MHAVVLWGHKIASNDIMEMELQVIVYQLGAEAWTQIIFKSSKCSQLSLQVYDNNLLLMNSRSLQERIL